MLRANNGVLQPVVIISNDVRFIEFLKEEQEEYAFRGISFRPECVEKDMLALRPDIGYNAEKFTKDAERIVNMICERFKLKSPGSDVFKTGKLSYNFEWPAFIEKQYKIKHFPFLPAPRFRKTNCCSCC